MHPGQLMAASPMQSDRWAFEREVGRGGQAVTWLGRDRQTGEQVAIKVLSMRRAADWKGLELFQREAAVLEQLDHRAIPRYLDAFEVVSDTDVQFALVQEFVEGKTLEQVWQEHEGHPVFSERKTIRFLREMLEVLIYLHEHTPPVVHRDIKPGNVFERPDGSFALVDFGAVQAVVPATMGGSTFIGTSGYMAPEQLMGRAEPRSDLFSLGATAIQLLSGFHPGDLAVRGMAIEFDEVVRVSDALRNTLHRLVAPTPAARFTSAREALKSLPRGATPTKALARKGYAPAYAHASLEVAPDQASFTFHVQGVHPWKYIATITWTTAVIFALGFGKTTWPVWLLPALSVLVLLAIGSTLFARATPVLVLTSDAWRLENRRRLAPNLAEHGRSSSLEVEIERRTVAMSFHQKENIPILILRDGVDEQIVIAGDQQTSDKELARLVNVIRELRDQMVPE